MERADASDLLAFLAVARERSFTRAAARLAISQPTLSQTVQSLEERLGVRLLNCTTRSVTPTQAGERLLLTIGPKFDEMDVELGALSELREKPAGTIRITATEYAAQAILMPAMAKIAPLYPDIKVEVMIDVGLTNIVAAQYDAGIRPGELVAKDMIAVRVGPDLRMAVVGSPSYFESRKRPRTPQDLTQHNCVNLHLPTHGGSLYAWEFERNGRERQRARGRATRLQQLRRPAARRPAGSRPGLPDRRSGSALPVERRACPSVGGLVPAVFRISPVLSQPPAAVAGVFAVGRCPSLSREITTLNTFEELQSISAKTRRSPRLSRAGLLRPSRPTECPLCARLVAKVENKRPKKSRES